MKTFRRSAILEAGVGIVAPPLVVFSIYLLFAGHNQPGGGFAGGLVAGVAVLLVWSGSGPAGVRRMIPVRSTTLLGAGLAIAALGGFASILVGLDFLESGFVEFTIPGFGPVKIVSALVFDAGVYLVVAGMVLGLVQVLGGDGLIDGEASS